MPLILLTNHYDKEPLDILKNILPDGFQLCTLNKNDKMELVKKAEAAEYLLASGRLPIDEEVLSNAGRLKMIQRTGVGLDSLDLDEIKKRNIPVYINKGVNAESVAEHTLLLMLACLRRLIDVCNNTKNGIWAKQNQGVKNRELRGKVVGIIGMGSIGLTLAGLLKPFGVKIIYYDITKLDKYKEEKLGIRFVEPEELATVSDIVSLHCPLTKETKGMVNDKFLSRMKSNSIIINTARGRLIDEEALFKVLEERRISFAGLDVFTNEPPEKDSPLLKSKYVIATPHIGGITYDSFYAMMNDAMNNIQLYEMGEYDQIKEKKLTL